MGIVYRAKDKRLKRYVAIKLLPPELSFRRDVRSRFLREAETAAQLSHPNIVPIYSVDEVENLVFFVMACVDGDNLATRLKNRGPLPVADVRRILTEVGDALAYAHARGVIHRDIKPDNILMDGVDGRALVTDFGIARAASGEGDSTRLTATGIAIGTPAYMSPEQASGDREVDGRSDLYSLGIVAYQMLVGEPPFIGNTTPVLLVKHLAEAPIPVEHRRTDIPPDLAQTVMRLLQKSPDHRFQNANELVQSLKTGSLPSAPAGTPVLIPGAPRNQWSPPASTFDMNTASPFPASGIRPLSLAQTQSPMAGGVSAYNAPGDVGRTTETGEYIPTAAEWARFEDPQVMDFRKKFRFYLAANVALGALSIVAGRDVMFFSGIWTFYMAYKYAKMWSNDRDWRDVLYQPQHRMFGEVLSHLNDSFMATVSRKHREQLKAEGRLGNKMGITLSTKKRIPGMEAPPAAIGAGNALGNAAVSPTQAPLPKRLGSTPPLSTARAVTAKRWCAYSVISHRQNAPKFPRWKTRQTHWCRKLKPLPWPWSVRRAMPVVARFLPSMQKFSSLNRKPIPSIRRAAKRVCGAWHSCVANAGS
jgi:eukaryotic-like serine/threonine-protein kinase